MGTRVVEREAVRVADRRQRAGEHGEAGDGLAPFERDIGQRRPAQLQHLEAAGPGTEHAYQMVEHVARHHAGASRPLRFTRVVSGTVKSMRSRTKASRSCVWMPMASVPKAPSCAMWPSKWTTKPPGAA